MTANDPRFRCPQCQAEFSVESPANDRSRRRWLAGLAVVTLILAAIGIAAYRYKGYLITFWNLINDAIGNPTLSAVALAVTALAALCAVGWLFLPFFLTWAYWDLRRRLGGPASHTPGSHPVPSTPSKKHPAPRSSGSPGTQSPSEPENGN